ncbi:MAG: metal-dependent transcriptional regulator [Candidatus Hydrogenedentes bacterium]|nr:metal-dependent transcriptional regulator [Candidatus Hydrogenedentota bacterium]
MEHNLTPKLEDYLLTIYHIERKQKVTRPKAIVEAQKVASSTVTAALQSLAEKGMINYEPYELITLTKEGREKAEDLAIRHDVVRSFLEDVLGLEPGQAKMTTCDMEHSLDRQVLERFVCFVTFIQRQTNTGVKWLDAFRHFLEEGADGQSCEECVKEHMETLHFHDE